MDFAEVKRVCQTCTIAGLNAINEVSAVPVKAAVSNTATASDMSTALTKATTFIYMSAEGTPDDLRNKPFLFGDYSIMRVSQFN